MRQCMSQFPFILLPELVYVPRDKLASTTGNVRYELSYGDGVKKARWNYDLPRRTKAAPSGINYRARTCSGYSAGESMGGGQKCHIQQWINQALSGYWFGYLYHQ